MGCEIRTACHFMPRTSTCYIFTAQMLFLQAPVSAGTTFSVSMKTEHT